MDNVSAYLIVGSAIGFIFLLTLLILLLYKPAKKLDVHCEYKTGGTTRNELFIKISLENTGKRPVKIMAPYISFYSLQHSQIFQLNPSKIHCHFPRLLKVREQVSCEAEIRHYKSHMEKTSFHPSHIKVIIRDSVGMKFNSNPLEFDYKLHFGS